MTRIAARIAVLVIVGALFAGGCGDSGGTSPSPNVPASVATVYASLGSREDAHHRLAVNATSSDVLRLETGRYAADMDSMMDAMMDSCLAMGTGGMMADHEMRHMGDVTDTMDELIRAHHARMDSLATLGEMRDECVEHHDGMLDVLDEMHDALPRRGMMGGGMMGGGMR